MDEVHLLIGHRILGVVCHDIANPMTLVQMGVEAINGRSNGISGQRGKELISRGAREQKVQLIRMRGIVLLLQWPRGLEKINLRNLIMKRVEVSKNNRLDRSFSRGSVVYIGCDVVAYSLRFVMEHLIIDVVLQFATDHSRPNKKIRIRLSVEEAGWIVSVQYSLCASSVLDFQEGLALPLEELFGKEQYKSLLLLRFSALVLGIDLMYKDDDGAVEWSISCPI